MKHIKLLFAVAILCAATFVGYNVYTNATMTEEERLIQANIDALSSGEDGQTSVNDYVMERVKVSVKLDVNLDDGVRYEKVWASCCVYSKGKYCPWDSQNGNC